jgi:hypothetical protein
MASEPRNALSKVDRNMLQAMALEADKASQIRTAVSEPNQPERGAGPPRRRWE